MRLTLVINPGMAHHATAARLLADGLRRHGVKWDVVDRPEKATGDVVACWGWRLGKVLQRQGRDILLMERGYVGDRNAWTSIGWNGLNGRAQFPFVEDGGRRWNALFPDAIKPLNKDGTKTVIFGQVSGDASIAGAPLQQFYSGIKGIEVVYRRHPLDPRGQTYGLPAISGTLAQTLKQACRGVAWNSNALTDAALAGVEVIAGDIGAMAWPVSLDAGGLAGRERWAHRLAWCQWSNKEIANGDAWAALNGPIRRWSAQRVEAVH